MAYVYQLRGSGFLKALVESRLGQIIILAAGKKIEERTIEERTIYWKTNSKISCTLVLNMQVEKRHRNILFKFGLILNLMYECGMRKVDFHFI